MSNIRRFLCKKRKADDTTIATPSSSTDHQKEDGKDEESPLNSSANLLDIGLYLDSNSHADDKLRLKLLREPWAPSQIYNFKKDVNIGAKRAFQFEWLTTYPWLTYSAIAKGPLCRVCVLFRLPAQRGLQGQFIVSPYLKYHKFHEAAQCHATTQWHRDAIVSSKNFEKIMARQQLSVHEALDSAYHKEVEENRVKLRSIISTILFCEQHDLPVRGKSDEGFVFKDLLHFRIESGDKVLKNHLESGAKNFLYISHQNHLIQTCSDVFKGKIIDEVKRASVFSVLADEIADISGTEQLSIGVRYLRYDQENKKPIICEEFLGFVPLQELNSKSISEIIIQFLKNCDLDLNRLVGQGYDGCAAMAGHISGVQKLINNKYPMALFFHCASHILNLVINDLNDVNEIRNTTQTTKEIINFFSDSTLRRNMISNIPLFCETRWSAKYKSIRIFSEIFSTIMRALKELSENASNSKTKVKAYQLYTIATTPTYIVTLLVIAVYSAKLEPVCNQLQQVNMNIKAINDHVSKLTNVLQSHRNNALIQFTAIFEKTQQICEELDIEFKCPRVIARQTQRSNQPSENVEEFFRRSIFIPYLDSIISSLRDRFSSTHEKAFSLMQLHSDAIKKLNKVSFLAVAKDINSLYGDILSNFIAEATTWYEMWKNEATLNESLEYADLICQATPFYPAVAEAIKIGLTLPATTCSIERSFSTLRRVKIWNRSTMGDERLSGLCMLSVHRKRVQEETEFIDNVTNEFRKQLRRLKFLFKH